MSPEFADLFFKFILPVLGAAVSYGAVKQDIKNMHDRMSKAEADCKRELDRVEHAALRAHERMDNHVSDYHRVK